MGREVVVRAKVGTDQRRRFRTNDHAWVVLKRKHKQHSASRALPCWLAEYGMCLLDGMPIDYAHNGIDASYEADHRIPRSVRPDLAYVWSNLGASHRRCNRSRQAKAVVQQHIWVRPSF